MGIFGFLNKKSDSNAMPIGAALDMLEGACRAYPQLVLEWIDANPSRAQRINGLADNAICRRFKGWDGPYSITYKVGERRGQVVNMFFQNLRRDIKTLCEMVAEAGHEEDEERLCNDEHLVEDLQMLQILSLMAVSGKALDLFPSLLNTESQYDSKSIVLVGMVHYYAFVHSLLGNNEYMTLELFKVVDKMRERERGLNKKDFVPLNFIELADNLFTNLDRYPKSLEERTHDLGTEMYKLYAFNIASWVYFTLTKGKSVDVERDKYVLYLTNLMISQIAWDMCGVEHNVKG